MRMSSFVCVCMYRNHCSLSIAGHKRMGSYGQSRSNSQAKRQERRTAPAIMQAAFNETAHLNLSDPRTSLIIADMLQVS